MNVLSYFREHKGVNITGQLRKIPLPLMENRFIVCLFASISTGGRVMLTRFINILLFYVFIVSVGCNIIIELPLNLHNLGTGGSTVLYGNLYAQISSCHSYEDSRKLSDSVLKAQQNIPLIFTDAQYVECFTKEFKSLAHFIVPFVLDKEDNGQLSSDSHLNLIYSDDRILAIAIPNSIKDNLAQFEERSFGTSLELEVQIKLLNDTMEDLPVNVMASYVDGQPYLFSPKTLLRGQEVVLKLSDVATDNALQGFETPFLFPIGE